MNWKKINETFWNIAIGFALVGIFVSMVVACNRTMNADWACRNFGYSSYVAEGSDINGELFCISFDGLEIVPLDSLFGLEE